MNTQRKILIIVITLSVVVIVGLFFAYQSFIKDGGSREFGSSTSNKGGRNILFPGSELFEGDKLDTTQSGGTVPTLRQISNGPSSGAVIFTDEERVVIRYVDRATGHIYETTSDSLDQNRISNTTIPRIQKSTWSADGNMVILQYLDDNEILKSFYGKVSKDAGVLDGWFLSNNIIDIAVHEDSDIFYIQKIANDSQGIVSNFDGTNGKAVFSSTIYDWIPTWIGNSAGVTTKASNNIFGYLYKLKSGTRTKLFSTNGLITNINPDGSRILLSISDSDGTDLFIHDISTDETINVPFTTLADKCVWVDNSSIFCASPYNLVLGTIPDDWYKGVTSFSDDIWSYNIDTDVSQLIYDAEAAQKTFDAIDLSTDSEHKMLLFTDKNTLILWGLTL